MGALNNPSLISETENCPLFLQHQRVSLSSQPDQLVLTRSNSPISHAVPLHAHSEYKSIPSLTYFTQTTQFGLIYQITPSLFFCDLGLDFFFLEYKFAKVRSDSGFVNTTILLLADLKCKEHWLILWTRSSCSLSHVIFSKIRGTSSRFLSVFLHQCLSKVSSH